MDALKLKRTPIRGGFTKALKQLTDILVKDGQTEDIPAAEMALYQLEEKAKKLFSIDKEILDAMIQGNCSADEYQKEYDSNEAYEEKLVDGRFQVKRMLERRNQAVTASVSIRPADPFQSAGPELRQAVPLRHRLPEIELRKFNGLIQEYLPWWNQFKRIHEDPNIDAGDKFHYLLQSTTERAHSMVSSFPATADNYGSAVKLLQSRFGREDLLIQYYVRDILKIVLNGRNGRRKEVASLYDDLECRLRALGALGVTREKYAAILFPLIESCLPDELLREYERSTVYGGAAEIDKGNDLDKIMNFLKIYVEGEEKIMLARSSFNIETKSKNKGQNYGPNYEYNSACTASELHINTHNFKDNKSNIKSKTNNVCLFCDRSGHTSESCNEMAKMSLTARKNLVLKKGACFICLKRGGHKASECKSKNLCVLCQKRHYICLCPELLNKTNSSVVESVSEENTNIALTNQAFSSNVVLQTLVVKIFNGIKEISVRAIIDTGSSLSYLTQDIVDAMGYDKIGEVNVVQKLFGGVETSQEKHFKFKVHVKAIDSSFSCNFDVLNQKVICSQINRVPLGPWIAELDKQGIQLSDREDNPLSVHSDIKLLIGANVAGKLLTGHVMTLENGLVSVGTRLGYTLMGKTPCTNNAEKVESFLATSLLVKDNNISQFWDLEVIGIRDSLENKSKLELQEDAMRHFNETLKRNDEGRYEVSLPWVLEKSILPDNKNVAVSRAQGTKSKLLALDKIEAYNNVFSEWLSNDIIERVNDDALAEGHYLPHRPVFKEFSSTKVRPVYDASCKNKGLPSLNDCLEKGPNLIELIPSLLSRFRINKYGVTSDIERAFLQINIAEKDRDYLRFLWFDENLDKLVTYRHKRVCFGVKSSPFLLSATINHHLNLAPNDLLTTANILKRAFYVDNCITSLTSENDVHKFVLEAKLLLSSACFNLRDWQTNLKSDLPIEIENIQSVPVLGLVWNLNTDTLMCRIDNISGEEEFVSKRVILSKVQQVYDPIGFTCPVTLIPKLIIQKTWSLKLKWDEPLPSNLAEQFNKWWQQVHLLKNITIPRWLGLNNIGIIDISIHIFSDAFKDAYATCIFLRVELQNEVVVRFINARSRVAPISPISIPRLELLSCLIGSRLASTVLNDLKDISGIRQFYWTDSTTALSWIQRPNQWGTFVSNRVNEIRSLTDSKMWHHIPGIDNPADLPSRGCLAEKLLLLKWWEGPSWLYKQESEWPSSTEAPNEDAIAVEKRKSVLAGLDVVKPVTEMWYNKHFSSYLKILRMLAWILRFVNNSRKLIHSQSSNLSSLEIEKAEELLIKLIQKESFININDEKIRNLRPFYDDNGILRVRTKVIYRQDTLNFRYPIILPSNHPVVNLLIEYKHKEYLHAGVSLLMTKLREKFWIIKTRKTIRAVIQQCVCCKKFSAKPCETEPVSLPMDRVQDSAVFQVVGVDLAGPLFLKDGQKSWIVLYTCAVYRAVHLELTTSLSTEAFLQTLRRFIARRGRPTTIYSDNGSNFIGANRSFSNIDWDVVSSTLAVQRINWKFNPPTASWFGGFWERIVQMVKKILRKILGRASLTYEELLTMLCDCEGMVNSRPLTYVSEDLNDLAPLTPSMFLHEIQSSSVADLDTLEHTGLNKRSQYKQILRDHLKNRFRIEYLGQLRQQTIDLKKIRPLSLGDIVLVHNDDKKRAFWSLARVTELMPGKDGKIRVAQVKTESGLLLRPVKKLYYLEIQDSINFQKPDGVRTKSGRIINTPNRLAY